MFISCEKDNAENDVEETAKWHLQFTEDNMTFGGIHFTENNIYVVASTSHSSGFGSEKVLYKSTDKGVNWQILSLNDNFYYYGIHFLDDENWLLAGQRMIAKTFDGGTSWEYLDTGLLQLFGFDSSVPDKIFGYGNGFCVSADTFQTWNANTFEYVFSAMDFINNNIGYATSAGNIYKTVDGGVNWEFISEVSGDITTGFDFFNESKGIAINIKESLPGEYPDTEFIYTDDGGVTWTTIDIETDSIVLEPSSCCYFRTENDIYAGALNGLFRSDNLDWNFVEQSPIEETRASYINDIEFIGEIGIATGNGGIYIYN